MNERTTGNQAAEEHRGFPVPVEPHLCAVEVVRLDQTQRPHRSARGRPPDPADRIGDPRADQVSGRPGQAHQQEVQVPSPATWVVAKAPPKSIVTSLGMGMHAESSSISRNMARYPYCSTACVMKCSTAFPAPALLGRGCGPEGA